MRALWLFLLGVALALEAPEALEARRGGFLSLPVRGEGQIRAEAPDYFLPLTGEVEGEGLLNFLVQPGTPAGEYLLRLRDAREEKVVRVRVLPEAGLSIRVPPGSTGVEGETLTYTFVVQNTGNAPDRVRLEVRSLLPYRLETALVELAPGESRTLTLEVRLVGRNRDTATLLAYSGLDPKVRAYGLIETVILPFSGAETLGRNALRYRFGLRATLGQNLSYALALGLSGSLSDYVGLSSRLEWDGSLLKGEARLSGEGFALGFRGHGDYLRLEGEWGPWQAYYAFGSVSPTLGLLYQEGPGRLSFSLSAQSQRLDLGYSLREGTLTLTPYLALRRRVSPEEVRAGGGLEARWEEKGFSLAGRLEYLEGVSLRMGGATRFQEPFGLKGEVAFQNGTWQGSLQASQTLGEEVRGSLTLRGGGDFALRLGLDYRPLALPFSLAAGIGYQGGLAWDLGARVRLDGLEAGGNLAYQLGGLAYGAYLGYRERNFSVRAALNATAVSRSLLLAGEGRLEELEGSFLLGYDLLAQRPEAQVSLLYRAPQGFGLGALTRYRGGVWSLQVLGVAEFKGGFNTPEEVVQAFGGRATGVVEGQVFHDQNRDGQRNPGEPFLPGAKVRVGALEAQVDQEGRYRLELYPGVYRLEVGGLEASLALRRRVEVRVEKGQKASLDLPVETVVGLTGLVYLDVNRNGEWDESEPPVPFARVVLEGQERRIAYADGQGVFLFGGLLPGRYSLRLDPESLPRFHEPAQPPIQVDLAPGPLPRLRLGVREAVREVVKTLTEETLALYLEPLPPTLPPGAELLLKARVQGKPERVVALAGEKATPLEEVEEDLYQAYLPVPQGQTLEVLVRAERGEESAEATALLLIRPGPLGLLNLSPALADPGEVVRVEARLLRRFTRVEVRLLDLRLPLEAQDLLTFKGFLPAPKAPGLYEVELWGDGEKIATARLRVRD